jgi:hypothetical protein
MISTKNIVNDIRNIPSSWIFQYYWTLPQPLNGQRVQVKSFFNPSERTPSMFFYYKEDINDYRFKCFSTNNQGSGIDLLAAVKNISIKEAVKIIMNDYNTYVSKHGSKAIKREFTETQTFEITEVKNRQWAKIDEEYWSLYNIGSDILNKFNVKPLEYVVMNTSLGLDTVKNSKISNSCMYGYFTKNNELYKVYQPMNDKYKFMKLADHLQGLDQLTYSKPYLIICSSLKDAMCLVSLGYGNIEVVAPDSENTMIPPMYLETFKSRYTSVITLFDKDPAGKKSAEKYATEYGINTAILPMMKDLSDSIAVYGPEKVRERLTPILRKALSLT